MHFRVKIPVMSIKETLRFFFLIFCFVPFLIPNPIVVTNIQPYAAMFGTLIFILYGRYVIRSVTGRNVAIILGSTFGVSFIIMLINGISVDAIRGVYNYFALFIIPCSVIISLEAFDEFPEKLCKYMISIWFFVSSIQLFIYRGFMTQLISGVRWSFQYRGVVGLASEPSFLGIACFYFLHIVRKFEKQRVLFSVMVLIMGSVYAQSTMGILFLAGYYSVFLLDEIKSKKGIYIWFGSMMAAFGFWHYLNTRLVNSRLYVMVDAFKNGGVNTVLEDGSANVRLGSIENALQIVKENRLFPNGFGNRIGSAYGGLLVELGLFAIPAILLISYTMSLTFDKRISRIIYFIVITVLLLNNTQIGNPLLLMVIGMNLQEVIVKKRISVEEKSINVKNYT